MVKLGQLWSSGCIKAGVVIQVRENSSCIIKVLKCDDGCFPIGSIHDTVNLDISKSLFWKQLCFAEWRSKK